MYENELDENELNEEELNEENLNVNTFQTLADKEILSRVAGLSDVVLQKYRRNLRQNGILKTRERLMEDRDIPLLREIVLTKRNNPTLFYSRIIEIIVARYIAKEKLSERIFDNSDGAKINEKFRQICGTKEISEEQIDDFFCNLNEVPEFLKLLGCEDMGATFNGMVDVLISAIVGRNAV